jgi:hypothetical protein
MVRAKEWGAAGHAVLCCAATSPPERRGGPLPAMCSSGLAAFQSAWQGLSGSFGGKQERGEAGHAALLPGRAAHRLSTRDVGHDWQTWRICLAPLGATWHASAPHTRRQSGQKPGPAECSGARRLSTQWRPCPSCSQACHPARHCATHQKPRTGIDAKHSDYHRELMPYC